MNMQWNKWVREVTCHASARQIAKQVGVSPTAVGKWLTNEPSLGGVVSIAIAYRAPIVEGLIAAGMVDGDNLDGLFSIRCIPTADLIGELRRRQAELRVS